MALASYDILLTGVAQRVSTVLGQAVDGISFRQLIISADPANAAVAYVGADSGISSTSHGFALDPTQATAVDKVSIGPFESGAVRLSDLWVLGTNNERLHILGVPF